MIRVLALSVDNLDRKRLHPQCREHHWVKQRVCYAMPGDLLRRLIHRCRRSAFDPYLLRLEIAISRSLRHNQRLVGYDARSKPIVHSLLPVRDLSLPDPPDAVLNEIGWNPASYKVFLEEAQQRSDPCRDALRGYLGWLTTNSQYLAERDALFAKCESEISKNGIPQSGPVMFGPVTHGELVEQVRSKRTMGFLVEFAEFYARWRILHLVTRELPEPLAPQMPIIDPSALFLHIQAGGVSFYQPDTIPVPTRDTLRNTLEDIRVNMAACDHLDEWHKIVGKGRSNNHTIRKFGQIFNLHFYWSLLEERHPGVFKGRTGRIQSAFGDYLGVDSKAIEKARKMIKRRLTA